MRKVFLFVFPFIVSFIIFGGFLVYQKLQGDKGLLQVTANPQSAVFLGSEKIGDTPLCKCKQNEFIKAGEYEIKIVPKDPKLKEAKHTITISRSVLTVVDRTFHPDGTSEGSFITLSKLPKEQSSELLVLSQPDTADVWFDNTLVGKTPVILTDIAVKTHEISVAKPGFIRKSILVLTAKGHKLSSSIFLSKDSKATTEAALNASLTPTPTPSELKKVEILQTPTGFLRVREASSSASLEVGRVEPGEVFTYLDEDEDWIHIQISEQLSGWVNKQYATLLQ